MTCLTQEVDLEAMKMLALQEWLAESVKDDVAAKILVRDMLIVSRTNGGLPCLILGLKQEGRNKEAELCLSIAKKAYDFGLIRKKDEDYVQDYSI